MDIAAYFFDEVIPAYEHYVDVSEQKDNKKSMLINAAKNASEALFSFREHLIPPFTKQNLSRDHVAALCPDFHWLGDIVNAQKHKTITNRVGRIIDSKAQIQETIVNTYFYEEGTEKPRNFYGYMDLRIMVYPNEGKGSTRDVLEIATNVVNFWGLFLIENSIINKQTVFYYKGNDILTREECEEKGMNVNLKPSHDQSLRWTMIARYFEPETNRFERWGFKKDGSLLAVKISENAPNSKAFGYFKPS